MRTLIIAVACVSGLAACVQAPPNKTALWRDVSGQHRGDSELHTAAAQCNYEISLAEMNAPSRAGPTFQGGEFTTAMNNIGFAAANQRPPRQQLEESCMRAKGWQLAGFE
jgi:hypothetical protein